jgi:membrane protein
VKGERWRGNGSSSLVMTDRIRDAYTLVKRTVTEWSEDSASTRAAALAYFTIFSIAPTLIIATAIAAAIFGRDAAQGEIHRQIQGLVGASGAKLVEDAINSANKPGRGTLATLIGLVVLIFAATGVFAELQNALNAFWKAKPRHVNGIIAFLRVRFLSFAMVLGIGFLLLVSLVVSAALSAFGNWIGTYTDDWATVAQLINHLVAFAIITVLFAMIYKVLPDRKVAWRDVWLGALVTSLLFNLGKIAIGLYIARTSVASSYGAAGALAVLLVWVYYSAMILFLGAEFTQVYARMFGSLRGEQKKTTSPLRHDEEKPKGRKPWGAQFPGTARSAGGH